MRAPEESVRAGAGLRLLRAAVFAAACVALAAAGHSLAACAVVPLPALAAGFTLVWLAAAALAGRPRTFGQIGGLLLAGQLLLHVTFAAFPGREHTATGSAASGAGSESIAEQAARFLCGVPASAISPERAHQVLTRAGIPPHGSRPDAGAVAAPHETSAGLLALLPSLPMLLGHLLAAVVAGRLLQHGERALFRLVALSGEARAGEPVRALRAAWAMLCGFRGGAEAPAYRIRPRRRADEAETVPGGLALAHVVVRRGPPVPGLTLAA